jgi:hypothetical protein
LVPVASVREALRDAFGGWGLPGLLRVDNGYPWGSKGDLPTDLALWLIGLGVELWWNAPARPQDNGVVERSQGTGKRWGEPQTAADSAELQARLDALDALQRGEYPYREKKSRTECYPALTHSGRVYARPAEAAAWDWGRVAAHLGDYCVPRRVDRKGQVSVYNRNHYVGKGRGGEQVWLAFNGETGQWVVSDEHGQILKEFAAAELSPQSILALEVTLRR